MLNDYIIPGILLVIGFVFLIKGADYFVEGSANIAKKLKVPPLIIGMTIVAMGTSLPECSVSITASMNNSNSLAISNAIGSNIFNLIVVCGICALFTPLCVAKDTLKRDFPVSILCAAALLVFGFTSMVLGRSEGIVLLIAFAIFLLNMIRTAVKERNNETKLQKEMEEISQQIETLAGWKCAVYIVIGIVAIKFGGDFVVDGATTIARSIGITETVIGLTIVAVGTSLPELVTSIVAAKKNEVDMAVGNVIGSNIFNILLVLGVAATISPIAFIMENVIDIIILIVLSILVWVFAWTKSKLERREGIVMLIIYVAYMAYVLIR